LIVDGSAVLAVLRAEAGFDRYVDALARAAAPLISAGTYVEVAAEVDSVGDPVLSGRLEDLLVAARVRIEPVSRRQAELARRAMRDFGPTSGHPAALGLGEAFAYALARDLDQPLLHATEDGIAMTGLASALGPPPPTG
jgi:ribonuclease VapC